MPKKIKKDQLDKLPGPVKYVLTKWQEEIKKRKEEKTHEMP